MWRRFPLGVSVLSLAVMAAFSARAGIDFDAMPVGCAWTIAYADGTVVTETYLGKSNGKHKTRVAEGRRVVRHSYFDSRGRLVRKDWEGGKWETFSPYSCFSEPGDCTYRYRNADGADQNIAGRTTAKGKGFTVKGGPVGGERYPDEYFELGAFGLMSKNKSANYSARLTGTENCGTGS